MTPEPITYVDISVKARCANPAGVKEKLMAAGARFEGVDHQCDEYYPVPIGKLKFRKGNIETLLTHYLREELNGYNRTTVFLYERDPSDAFLTEKLNGLKCIGTVRKDRSIFFAGNVKFHVDEFPDGRCFVEIEVMDREGRQDNASLQAQASEYARYLGISGDDIIPDSYIDFQ